MQKLFTTQERWPSFQSRSEKYEEGNLGVILFT